MFLATKIATEYVKAWTFLNSTTSTTSNTTSSKPKKLAPSRRRPTKTPPADVKPQEFFGGQEAAQNKQTIDENMSAMALSPTAGQPTPYFSPNSYTQHQIPADIDLEGGTITHIEETEEIDPHDNCKVHITRYHILSSDRTEESTITKRRKLKINCTQSLKRIEYTNGKEAKFEEKTMVLGNLDMLHANGNHDGNNYLAIQNGYDQDPALNEVFLRTQDTFMTLLNQKRDQLVQMFPDLFTNLRTQPEIFSSPATTFQEVIQNADGSTTIKSKSSKAFSSHYSREETYINGVKKDTKCKFRAFMEYDGPEGGFRIKLNDKADEDLSEEENDTDEDTGSLISRLSRSGFSELPDSSSAVVVHRGDRSLPQLINEPLKRFEKAWHSVNELVESEHRYVQKLGLLEKFRTELEQEKLLDKRQMVALFSNLASLFKFHNEHLLPQLMDRLREWQTTKRISDVMRKQGPFLKMYSEYTNNYKNATQMFEECARKKRIFEIIRKIEKLPECENLSLVSHFICPVQRVMRYQLLLNEYKKHLKRIDSDYEDTSVALDLVVDAASHANEMMRKLDRYRSVLEVQELLGNSIPLVSPSRELLKQAKVMKISSTTNRSEERVLYVFNDLILLCSERAIGIGGKFKIRAIFDPFFTQICEGDNLEKEHSFYLRGGDGQSGPSRCVELFCNTQNDKADLINKIWSVIDESHQKKNSFSSSLSSQSITSPIQSDERTCFKCENEFTWLSRGIACNKCGKKYCRKCFGSLRDQKRNRFCDECITSERVRVPVQKVSRQNLLDLPAQSDEIIKASYVQLKVMGGRTLNRYFVLRKNFCLYSYNNKADKSALCMLPIPGCEIVPSSEKLSFTIRHMRRQYNIMVPDESDHAEWLAALILSANAQIPQSKSA